MAYLQSNLVPPEKSYVFSLKDFSGGLNNRSEVLEDREASDLINMMFTNGEVMEKRKGQRLSSDLKLDNPITFIDEFKAFKSASEGPKWGSARWGERFHETANFLVVASDKEVYIDKQKALDVKAKICGISHEGYYFITDGDKTSVYGKFPKVPSTYVKIVGEIPGEEDNMILTVVSPPEGYVPLDKSIVTVQTIQTVDGIKSVEINNYWYELEKRDNQEIKVDTKYYAEFNTEKETVKLYDLDEVDDDSIIMHLEGVLNVDYTNKKIWYEPCKAEIEDEYKGANVIPKNIKYIVGHKGRIFASGDREDDDNIFISDVGNPFYFPAGLPMQIPPDSDKIVGLTVYDDAVIVGRERDIYAISGETNRLDLGLELFNLRKLNTHTGFANNTCYNHVHNYLFFIGNDGNAYALGSSRQEYRMLSTQLINDTIDMFKEPINMSYGDIRDVVTCFNNDYWYVSIEDKVLIYSYRHKAWTMFNGFNARSFYILNNELYWGNTNGEMCTFSRNYLDFGKPYECYWSSKFFDLDEPSTNKYFKEFNVISESHDNYNNDLYVEFNIDHYGKGNMVHLKPKVSDDTRINNVAYSIPFRVNKKGKNIRFTFVNGITHIGEVELYTQLQTYPKLDGSLVYVKAEDKYYLYRYGSANLTTVCDEYDWDCIIKSMGWVEVGNVEINQPMKVFQVNFKYKLSGGR